MRNSTLVKGIFSILFLAACLPGQIYPSYNYEPERFRSIYNFLPQENGRTTVLVYLYVPSSSITFVRDGEKYNARYTFSAGIYKRNKQIEGKSGARKVMVEDYRKTKSAGNEYLDSLVFSVKPGEYDIRLSVTDGNGGDDLSLQLDDIKVPQMQEGWSLSNPVFLDSLGRPMSVVATGDSVTLHTAYIAGEKDTFILEHYFNEDDFSMTDTVVPDGSGRLVKRINLRGISGGKRDFRARIKYNGKKVASSMTSIRFRASYSDMSEDDLESELYLLGLVGTRREIKKIEKAESKDRDSLVAKLWKDRDPTPETPRNEFKEEFMRRVEYANTHFSGIRPGYRSDMGKIYIEYGPPDEIERHPFDPDTYAYVKWYYYSHHTVYTFVDRLGDGDYILWSVE